MRLLVLFVCLFLGLSAQAAAKKEAKKDAKKAEPVIKAVTPPAAPIASLGERTPIWHTWTDKEGQKLDARFCGLAGEYITLQAREPGRWLAQSSLFDGLASASAERVMGLPIEPWLLGAHLPSLSPAIRTLRRLQNEMQMLLYQHPVNDARRTPINSIWIEGCGQLGGDCPAPMTSAASAVLLDDLREPWLLRDAAAWARAWQRLDAEVLPPLLSPAGARIAWCGPRQARWWIHQPPSVWQRLQRVLRPVQLNEVLSCDV